MTGGVPRGVARGASAAEGDPRLRLAVVVCACVALLGAWLSWAVFHGEPGQDWVVFHTAASRFFAGDMAMFGDARAFTDELNRSHAAWFAQPIRTLHPFVYPPVTLVMALAFGWMGYLWSLAAFLAVTAGLLVAALWPWEADLRGRVWLVAGVFACPASTCTIGAGQLSFLVAACVLAGVMWLERRPALAGLAFSLLCLKPQFVPLVPVALLAGRHWRAMAGGLAGGAGLVLASVAITGTGAWVAWIRLASGQDSQLAGVIGLVRVYDQSVHTCLRLLGAGEAAAGAGQIAAMAAVAVCVWLAFARTLPLRRRLVVLLCAMVFGAPHVGDYDHVLVAVAAVLCLLDARDRPGPVWVAAGAWIATLFNPPALVAAMGVPALTVASALTPLLVALLMAMNVRGGAVRRGLRLVHV